MISDTSVEAYDDVVTTGKLTAQQQRIVAHFAVHPAPLTRAELAAVTSVALQSVCGRVHELIEAGVLEELPARRCRMTGNSAHPVQRACDCCGTRGHMYRGSCERCQARMFARAPQRIIEDDMRRNPERYPEPLRSLIEQERERDALGSDDGGRLDQGRACDPG